MPSDIPTSAMVQLLALLRRSFPQYLRFASPYQSRNASDALVVLDDIVSDQNLLAQRVEEKLDAMGYATPSVEFPMEFTDSHDLSIDYLIDRALRYQQQDIAELTELSEVVACYPSIRTLVDEAQGMARAHEESLEECCATR